MLVLIAQNREKKGNRGKNHQIKRPVKPLLNESSILSKKPSFQTKIRLPEPKNIEIKHPTETS
jgi:hypothetical protein